MARIPGIATRNYLYGLAHPARSQKGLPKTHAVAVPRLLATHRCARSSRKAAKSSWRSIARLTATFRDIIYSDVRTVPQDGGMDVRRQSRPGKPGGHQCHPLPRRLRPLQPAHQPYRPGQPGPHQSLQSHLPGLLCQRQCRGLCLRAGFRDRAQDAPGPARPEARWPAASCSSRAASPPFIRASSTCCAWPRKWASRTPRRPPTASNSPTWNSPSRPRKPACTPCTCSSTASATTSTAARAAKRSGKRSCSASRTSARPG